MKVYHSLDLQGCPFSMKMTARGIPLRANRSVRKSMTGVTIVEDIGIGRGIGETIYNEYIPFVVLVHANCADLLPGPWEQHGL